MKYGICVKVKEPGTVAVAKKAGFDYVECNFQHIVYSDDAQREAFAAALSECGLECTAANCFIPGSLPLFDGYDAAALRDYVETGFARAAKLGVKTVVFGSGEARAIPEGADFTDCLKKLVGFIRNVVSPLARPCGITVAVEPLSRDECSFINTLAEGAMVVAAADCGNVKLLADNYHMHNAGEGDKELRMMKGLVVHSHISYPFGMEGKKRVYPTAAREWDYAGFVRAVEYAGCDTCTVEASALDFEREAAEAAELLRSL